MGAYSETNIQDGIGDEVVFDLFRDENVFNLDPAATLVDPAATLVDAQLGMLFHLVMTRA
jgi:hypothetical protein